MTNQQTSDPLAGFGHPVLSHVDLHLVYWGAAWKGLGQVMTDVRTKVQALCKSDYFKGLAEYNGDRNIAIEGPKFHQDLEELPKHIRERRRFTDPADSRQQSDVVDEIRRLLGGAADPKIESPKEGYTLLCVVLMPPGVACSSRTPEGEPPIGQHFYFDYGQQRIYYGWVLYASNVDKITAILSEELVEAITDPEPPTGWVMQDNIGVNRELCDVCEAVTQDVNGEAGGQPVSVRVKAYYSRKHGDAVA